MGNKIESNSEFYFLPIFVADIGGDAKKVNIVLKWIGFVKVRFIQGAVIYKIEISYIQCVCCRLIA